VRLEARRPALSGSVPTKVHKLSWLGIVRFGSDGNLRLHTEHGYAKATFAYDTHGHKIQEAYFDASDKMIKEAYFDEDGRPMLHKKNGCAKVMQTYNEHGYLSEWACLGVNDTPIVSDLGYSTLMVTSDELGVMRSCSYADANGQPVKPKGRVLIMTIGQNSQAQRLGLQVGDVITEYNQMTINAICELVAITHAPGDGLRMLVVERAGQSLLFKVQPGRIGVAIEEVVMTTLAPSGDKSATP
jgi:hypothetical protein